MNNNEQKQRRPRGLMLSFIIVATMFLPLATALLACTMPCCRRSMAPPQATIATDHRACANAGTSCNELSADVTRDGQAIATTASRAASLDALPQELVNLSRSDRSSNRTEPIWDRTPDRPRYVLNDILRI